ncbi:cap-specific mRNA (nucleoside-2'-O-)-methyltransferase 2-like [Planococcus citri]|uniref:cap-specific mRNA (nucleoside-2'-O-)-methyltransferase 2-like n=1 Tax=Planococcus citri TaxID=170843 RepID=UPI0031F9B6CC
MENNTFPCDSNPRAENFEYCTGNGNSTQNDYDKRNFTNDRYNGNCGHRSPRLLYSEDEEEELSVSLADYYGKDLAAMLKTNFNSKSYRFATRDARLPCADQLFSEEKWNVGYLSELQDIKRDLNTVKSKLDQYELSEWHKHTRSMNPADKVMRHLRRDVKVEFLTQAWCKFYELISKYDLIPSEALSGNTLFSYHMCEAPGAFVASLNHYLKLNHPNLKWEWAANSLNPYYEGNNLSEMINDDRFMLQTIKHWDFGPDMTGDITHPEYPSYLIQSSENILPHLVTADGSFDCQDNPDEQESSVSWLHFKETLNALNILRKGGNFVIKMFTFFESETVCLLTLLAASFEEIIVEKPATSKEGNSECYVVCQRYLGRDAISSCLDRLLQIDFQTYQHYSMFPLVTCNLFFYRQIIGCASHFASMQMDVIERNIRIYESNPQDPNLQKHCDFLQEKFVQYYMKKYKLRPIKLEDNIVNLPKLKHQVDRKPPQVIESKYRVQGSHAERIQRSALEAKDLLEKIDEELNDDFCKNLKTQIELPRGYEIPVEEYKLIVGKPIEVVQSSQFCHGRFMRIRNELIKVYGYRHLMITATPMPYRPQDEYCNCCNFSLFYMKNNCDRAQRECFYMLFEKLFSLSEGDSLKLVAFPLLTRFNVEVLCVLRQIFKQVIFTAPNDVLLVDMESEKRNLWTLVLVDLFLACAPSSTRAILSFLPIGYTTGPDNKFYEWLVEANNACLYNEIKHAVDFHLRR